MEKFPVANGADKNKKRGVEIKDQVLNRTRAILSEYVTLRGIEDEDRKRVLAISVALGECDITDKADRQFFGEYVLRQLTRSYSAGKGSNPPAPISQEQLREEVGTQRERKRRAS